ncbi:HGxxPAAW family protein [Brachybacterium sp. DNPG3]
MNKTYTVPPPPPHNEGKTVAAWTLTLTVVLGSVLVAFGMVLPMMALIGVGTAVIILGIVAGIVLSIAGFGKKRTKATAA